MSVIYARRFAFMKMANIPEKSLESAPI